MSSRSQTISLLLHLALVLLLLFWTVRPYVRNTPTEVTHIFAPPPAHAPAGGGGMHEIEPVRKGVLPPHSVRVFTPPMIQRVNYQPKLTVQPTIDAPAEVKVEAGALGDPNGIGAIYGGSGGPAGLGDGVGRSIGRGAGDRYGEGVDGVYSIGHGASAPVPIRIVEPDYSEGARKARMSGSVMVYAEIGPDGRPKNLHITQGMGMGLDEKALEAVAKWLFKPGLKDGRPVTVRATFEVNFRLL